MIKLKKLIAVMLSAAMVMSCVPAYASDAAGQDVAGAQAGGTAVTEGQAEEGASPEEDRGGGFWDNIGDFLKNAVTPFSALRDREGYEDELAGGEGMEASAALAYEEAYAGDVGSSGGQKEVGYFASNANTNGSITVNGEMNYDGMNAYVEEEQGYGTIQYFLYIQNDDTETELTVWDKMPEGFTLTSVTYSSNNSNTSCNITQTGNPTKTFEAEITLAANDTITITVNAQVDLSKTETDGGYIHYYFCVQADGYTWSDGTDVFELKMSYWAIRTSLQTLKTVDQDTHAVGDDVIYTITAKQYYFTYGEITDLTIEDEMPDGLEIKEVEITENPTDVNNNAVVGEVEVSTDKKSFTATWGQFKGKDGVELEVTATIVSDPGSSPVVNTAKVTANNNLKGKVMKDQDDNDVTMPFVQEPSASFSIVSPNLTINKTADEDTYDPGETVTYEIVVTNTESGTTATGVTISDELPEGLTLIDATSEQGTAEKNGNSFTVHVDSLEGGSSITVIVTATVGDSLAGMSVANMAYADSNETVQISDDAEISVLQKDPGLKITKTADKETCNVEDTVTYTIEVEQTVQGATANNVVVTDTLPDGLTLSDTPTTTAGTVSVTGNSFTVNVGDLSGSATITVEATVDNSAAGQSLTNTAVASDDNGDEVEDDATVSVSKPVLSVTKEAGKNSYSVGDTVTYEITVTQTAQDATANNVVITDTLPNELKLTNATSSDASVTIDGNTFTANAGSLDYNETATVTVTAEAVSAGSDVVNTAYANADNADEVKDNATVSVSKPVLSVTKKAGNSSYSVGDTVTYTITVTQTVDGATAENVVITDTLPNELKLTNATSSDATVAINGNGFTATADSLAYGQTITVTVTAEAVSAGSDVVNTAYANADNTDEASGSDTIEIAEPSLSITKTASQEQYYVGNTVTYTITVSQTNSSATAYGVTVTDTLPASLKLESAEFAKGTVFVDKDANKVTVSIDELAYSDPAVITVTATALKAGTGIVNTASAKPSNSDNEVTDDAKIDVLNPGLSITKSVSSGPYNVKDTITYTLTVTNPNEGSVNNDVKVTDELPSGLEITGDPVISGVEGSSVSVDGNTVTASIPELASSDTVTITIQAVIGSSLAGKTVENTAVASDPYGNEAEDTVTIEVLHPGLSIIKTVSDGPYNVKDTITYTLTVTDPVEGSVTYDVGIEDDLPKGLTGTGNISLSGVDGDARTEGNSYIVSIPVLKYGEAAVVTVEATIDASAVGLAIDNEAYTWDSYDDNARDDIKINVLKPALSIEKKSDSTAYSVSDTVTYTITVRETVAGAIARSVQVTDTLPVELELVGVDSDMGTVSTSGNSFTVSVGDMEATDTATITVTAIALAESEDIVNTAKATADYADPAEDDCKITVRRPDIGLYKTADAETYYAGDTLTYEIRVVNNEENATGENGVPSAYNVTVSDTVPEALVLLDVTADSEDAEVTIDGNSLTVVFPKMYCGEERVVTVTAEVLDVGNETVTNVATEVSDTTDPTYDWVDVDVIKPILELDKEAGKETYSVGEEVTYTITLVQTVPGLTAGNVLVTDTLPEGMSLVGATLSGVEGTVRTASSTVGTVTEGGTDEYVIRVAAGEEFSISFTNYEEITQQSEGLTPTRALAGNGSPEDEDGNPTEDHTTNWNRWDFVAEEEGTYYITVHSGDTGEDTVYTIIVGDTDDAGGTGTGTGSDDGSEVLEDLHDNTFTVSIPGLAFGETAVITVTAIAGKEGDYVNVAAATADHADPVEDDAPTTTLQPVLEVDKAADAGEYYVGDTVTYTITASQTVPGAEAYQAVISDTLPEGLELISVTPYGYGTVMASGSSEAGTDEETPEEAGGAEAAGEADEADAEEASGAGEAGGTESPDDAGGPESTGGPVVEIDGNSFTVTYAVLSGTETVTVEALALEDASNQSLKNTAVLSSNNAVPVEDDETVYIMQPGLSIEKTADEGDHFEGDTVIYTILINETVEGTSETDVVMIDEVPEGLTVTGTRLDGAEGSVSVDGNAVTAIIPVLPYGETATVTVEALVGEGFAGQELTNVATVSGGHTGEISDDAAISIPDPALSIKKTADKRKYSAGDTVTFTIKVEETMRGIRETDVTVADTFPDGIEITGEPVLHGVEGTVEISGNGFKADIPSLAYGEQAVITVQGTVLGSAAGQELTNVATAKGPHSNEVSDDAEIIINNANSPVATGELPAGPIVAIAALAAAWVALTAARRRRMA